MIKRLLTVALIAFLTIGATSIASAQGWQAHSSDTVNLSGVPQQVSVPAAGSTAIIIPVEIVRYGVPGDPEFAEVSYRLTQADGTSLHARLFDDQGLLSAASNPSSTATNFPSANGWRLMPKIAVGDYVGYVDVGNAMALEVLRLEVGYQQAGHVYINSATIEYTGNIPLELGDLQGTVLGDLASILGDPPVDLSTILTSIGTENEPAVAGRRQFFTVNIDDASNGGVSVVAFTAAGGGEWILESCVMRSNGTSADMTSLGLYAIDAGGADPDGQVEIISAATAVKSALDEDGEQLEWFGRVSIDSGEVIFVLPLGTGATALDIDLTCSGFGTTNDQSLTPN